MHRICFEGNISPNMWCYGYFYFCLDGCLVKDHPYSTLLRIEIKELHLLPSRGTDHSQSCLAQIINDVQENVKLFEWEAAF